MDTTILLVDDHQMVRDGLRAMLERQSGLRVVGEAGDSRSAIDLACSLKPDIVVMDIGMQGLNGIDAAREILAKQPRAKIIALSMHSDKRYVLRMLDAGAKAYLLKNCAFDDLVRAIYAVQNGQQFFSQLIQETLADIVRDTAAHAPNGLAGGADVVLTPRERQALQLLAEGKTSKEIAKVMNVSPKTVDTFRRDIMAKLDLHSVAELTRYAIKQGLSPLDE